MMKSKLTRGSCLVIGHEYLVEFPVMQMDPTSPFHRSAVIFWTFLPK
jgi:hypothetical protein